VEMGSAAGRRAFEAIGARAARDDYSGNRQVRGQIETTAATLAIPSGYVKPRRATRLEESQRGLRTLQ